MHHSLDEEMQDGRRFMRAALKEARKALSDCLPNPPVGCVLVRADQIIAAGYTQLPGQQHAEAMKNRRNLWPGAGGEGAAIACLAQD
jgi:pyrimidine deaminase RibD-like protein